MRLMHVEGYEGFYLVSDTGRVFSYPRKTIRKDGKSFYTTKYRELSQKTRKTGYKEVHLRLNGTSKSFLVHRLVCIAFLEKENGKNYVNHKNGLKSDNRLENLEWCTPSENNTHAYRVLKIKNPAKDKIGVLHWKSKKVKSKDVKTGEEIIFDALMDAKRAGFRPPEIWACCNGKQKTHYGKIWNYV